MGALFLLNNIRQDSPLLRLPAMTKRLAQSGSVREGAAEVYNVLARKE